MAGINGGNKTADFFKKFYMAITGDENVKAPVRIGDRLGIERKQNNVISVKSDLEGYCDETFKLVNKIISKSIKLVGFSTVGKWIENLKDSCRDFDSKFKEFKIPGDVENWREVLNGKVEEIIRKLEPPREGNEIFSSVNSNDYKKCLDDLNKSYGKARKYLEDEIKNILDEIIKKYGNSRTDD